MTKQVTHVGIAVKDLEKSIDLFTKLLGIKEIGKEEVADQKVRIAIFHCGNVSIELTEPTSADSPLTRFLEKRGEGIHHVSFEVDDIRTELARLKHEGFQLIDPEPRVGAGGAWVAFLHPKTTNGVLIEISQKPKAAR